MLLLDRLQPYPQKLDLAGKVLTEKHPSLFCPIVGDFIRFLFCRNISKNLSKLFFPIVFPAKFLLTPRPEVIKTL
jgi:hypothetical protein